MKYDYFAEDTDKIEKRRRKSEKRASLRKFFKFFLITLGVIVIVLAAVWALLRYVFVYNILYHIFLRFHNPLLF